MQDLQDTPLALTDPFLLGDWRVHPGLNRLEPLAGGEVLRLEPKAMDVLCALASRAGQTVSRDTLLGDVWQGRVVVDGVLARVIRALRLALGDDARQPRYIDTVSKRGYRLLQSPRADHQPAACAEPAIHLLTRAPVPSRSTRGVISLSVLALALALLPGTAVTQRVLWVDDHPDQNQREIAVLRQMGFAVHTALSNEQAAERLRNGRYAVLISDMFRPAAGYAGLRLPHEVTTDRNQLPPVVYYVSKVDAPRTAEGYPVTSRPRELFAIVRDLMATR